MRRADWVAFVAGLIAGFIVGWALYGVFHHV